MRKDYIILLILFAVSGFLYYDLLVEKEDFHTVLVGRVIDGDTIETSTGQKIRLKGINTPEKSEEFYADAKYFLKNNYENTSLQIDLQGTDRYGRLLAYSEPNKLLLERGLAYLYFYEKDKYYKEYERAEESARNKEVGLWKKSPKNHCLELINLKYKESKRCTNEEQLILKNNCNEDIKVKIKDDATHIYEETIEENSLFVKNYSCIWNNNGDSLYVRDREGLLIFHRYP